MALEPCCTSHFTYSSPLENQCQIGWCFSSKMYLETRLLNLKATPLFLLHTDYFTHMLIFLWPLDIFTPGVKKVWLTLATEIRVHPLLYLCTHTVWYLTPPVRWRGKNNLFSKNLKLHFSQKIKIIYVSSSLCPNQAKKKKKKANPPPPPPPPPKKTTKTKQPKNQTKTKPNKQKTQSIVNIFT